MSFAPSDELGIVRSKCVRRLCSLQSSRNPTPRGFNFNHTDFYFNGGRQLPKFQLRCFRCLQRRLLSDDSNFAGELLNSSICSSLIHSLPCLLSSVTLNSEASHDAKQVVAKSNASQRQFYHHCCLEEIAFVRDLLIRLFKRISPVVSSFFFFFLGWGANSGVENLI
uniref:Putative auxin efflux carrier component 1c n=1 Tax=Davidia involucrata TaxID=16924 RepID=A0A5B7A885_DAVIN